MKKKQSTKTSVEYDKSFLKQIRANVDNAYFLEVLYYYVRRALIVNDYNLRLVDGFDLNGRFLGYNQKIEFSNKFDTPVKSLGLAMSIRAFMHDKNYINDCYSNRLLFYDLDSPFISWEAHRAIMDCIEDDDFRLLYEMICSYKTKRWLTDEQKEIFKNNTIRPEYRNVVKFLQTIAENPDYQGEAVIKNNAFLYDSFEEYVVPKTVEYIGNTAFAYCENLKKITFEGKALLGKFPIIECNNLQSIIVPTDYVSYYKTCLPIYKNIIHDGNKPIQDYGEDLTLPEIDEEKFWHTLDKKATSYKIFWIMAITDIYYDQYQKTIPYKNILAKMVALAWKHLDAGKKRVNYSDQLGKYINKLKPLLGFDDNTNEIEVENTIIEKFEDSDINAIIKPLLKKVPYRFLSPWIPFTTDRDVVLKSNDKLIHCLYELNQEYICIKSEWLDFLKDNRERIQEFIINDLKEYIK